MKKLLIVALTLASGVAAFAQGTISFGNQIGTTFIAPIYGVNPADPGVSQTGASSVTTGVNPVGTTAYGGPLLSGTGYTLGLFVAGSSVTDPALFTLAGTAPFRVNANPAALPNGLVTVQTVTVAGITAGTPINFIVAAWDNQGGTFSPTTWNQFIGGTAAIGYSAITLSGALGGIDSGGNPVIPPSTIGWQSFSLSQVPEPSTFAMVGIGLASLLAIRRRK